MDVISVIFTIARSALDIFFVATLTYFLLKLLLRSENHTMVINGVVTFCLFYLVSLLLKLQTTTAIMDSVFSGGIIIIVILFQEEIKASLARVGSFSSLYGKKASTISFLDELTSVTYEMANKKTGALIAIVMTQSMSQYTKKAVEINADFSKFLVSTIFNKESPLHDGAIVIEKDKITHASTYFPISLDINLNKQYGTRHRAALTVSKETDCIIVIVSEETGNVSLARNGKLYINVDREFFKEYFTDKLEGGK